MVTIQVNNLIDFVAEVFSHSESSPEEARRIATYLTTANLTGHDSHGVIRVPVYVRWKKTGNVIPNQTPEIVVDTPSLAVVDGKFGYGQTVTPFAVRTGIEKCKKAGLAAVALRNAGHIGRVGAYAEQALAAGLISIHFVNVAGSVLVAPFGGTERRFSTAPFSVGVPTDPPVVLDFATSRVAEGKVLVASNGGKPLPHDALIEPDGRLSADPHTLYGDYPPVGPRNPAGGLGAIRAFGEHKGSGLAFMCELLAGAFTGGGCSGPVDARGRIANGMLSIFISPKHFGTEGEFKKTAEDYVAWVKSCRPAESGGEVLAPGEPEARLRAERLKNGVPLQPDTWESIVRCARSLGVAVPN
jgi:hydroxycarboxylate dehydrogenase B